MFRENYIVLTGRRGQGKCAVVDYDDAARVLARSNDWHLAVGGSGSAYAKTGRENMHRFILGRVPSSMEIDHANANTLDNRRINLRVVTHRNNMAARRANKNGISQFKGVGKHSVHRKRWSAKITVSGCKYHLGTFDTEVDAAKAYDVAARKHNGQYARCNFPMS